MSKGIATIIATVIMVVITIGLISTAYIYFSSLVTVGPVVTSMISPRCAKNVNDVDYNITIYLKNSGTETWNNIDWLLDGQPINDPNATTWDNSCDSVPAGETEICVFNSTEIGFGVPGTHIFIAIGPTQVEIPVTC